MDESGVSESQAPEPEGPLPSEEVRTQEPKPATGEEHPDPNVVSDDTADDQGPGEPVDPGVGGYAGRDPKTDIPRSPSMPETQADPLSHDAAPDDDKPRPAHD